MATTRQEENNQKLSNDIISLQEKVHNDIHVLHAKMDHIQEQINNQIVEVNSTPKIHEQISGPSSSDPPLYTEGIDSNHPLHSHSNSLPREPRLLRVKVKTFDGSDPQAWVTKMEHYFSLHGITDELTKIHYGILYLDQEG
jgi:hypothetical protein